ncbi:helix-turn-helix transcriptional regulator [Luteipulveratus sp. YIM 133132]|uniref:Helix-turn-helix transcriptional regulator n=1 Tax=Luteipulveratus flavus TaxID=3031728 RepID=A0ABT6C585_9MICO|nr:MULTISPECIES: helix-turn-helix transcriptional regulator [unclassified Luteipulveratus]MDE9367477.1 helix-turn-helix transcriptional regulator [Luteipulveratus sp. YIM 133132]MDF8263457.1 helix-turn-helix transcriptional regulator [Luteipulveratus sp. YIM 133296]
MTDLAKIIDGIGPRLRSVRQEREITLADLSERTGVSVSTLSRLESGQRKATLELLLALAGAYRLSLDELVGSPAVGDPRVRTQARRHGSMTMIPLSVQPGQVQVFKLVFHERTSPEHPRPRTHEGYEWLYVLEGRLRLLLGDQDLVLTRGEAVEFDTRVPHWFGSADDKPVEALSMFGTQGVKVHLRARAG